MSNWFFGYVNSENKFGDFSRSFLMLFHELQISKIFSGRNFVLDRYRVERVMVWFLVGGEVFVELDEFFKFVQCGVGFDSIGFV